jgi:hypothetical protein
MTHSGTERKERQDAGATPREREKSLQSSALLDPRKKNSRQDGGAHT